VSDQAAAIIDPAVITYSRGSSPRDNMPRNCAALDFREFAAAVLADRQPGKGPGYFAGAFDPPVRSATNAAPRRWLSLDLDGGLRGDEFAILCGVLRRWSGFIYETASSKPDEPRARIVLELDHPAPRADLIRAVVAVRARIDAELVAQGVDSAKWDTTCDRPEQPLFLPPAGAWSANYEGEPICLAELLADPVTAPVAKPLQLVAGGGGGNLSMLPTAATGPAVIQVDRHQDVLALAGKAARLVHFGGVAPESAWAMLRAEASRGRWTRTVDDGELQRAFDGELAACRNGLRDRTRDAQQAPALAGAADQADEDDAGLREVSLQDALAVPDGEEPCFWEGLIPIGETTLLAAHGGTGKSMFALQLAVAAVRGAPVGHRAVERGRVLFVSLEDPMQRVVRRLRKICQHVGASFDSVFQAMTIVDGTRGDGTLAREEVVRGRARVVATPAMRKLESTIDGHRLVIVDNASDAFDGNENERRLVRAFIRMLNAAARAHDAGVLLIAHVDKNTAKFGGRGQAFSGSTAWNNSARSRLAMTEEGGVITLAQEKFNLGKKAQPLKLQFTDAGVLVPAGTEPSGAELAQNIMESSDDAHVLSAIEQALGGGWTLSAAQKGPKLAHHVLSDMPILPKHLRENSKRISAAIVRLSLAGKIVREEYATAGKRTGERWVLVPVGVTR
jgi:RecA-family ATPase